MNKIKSRLYDVADELYAMAPWNWLYEDRLVALRHPETRCIDHISMMGAIGEHYCLALYLGPEARQRFNLIHHAEEQGIPLAESDNLALIMEAPQIQAAFSKRKELFKPEHAEIKGLGRRYRGANWPTFRVTRPGYSPAPINDEQAAWLTTAIEQCLEIAPTLKDDGAEIRNSKEHGPEILTRELRDGKWRTTWNPEDRRLFEFPDPEPDPSLAKNVALHRESPPVACEFQIVPAPIGPSRQKSCFPYFLLSMYPEQDVILGVEVLSVEQQPHDELIASVPDLLLRHFDRHRIRPASIYVRSQTSHAVFRKTAEAIGASLHLLPEIPPLDDAFNSMVGSLFKRE